MDVVYHFASNGTLLHSWGKNTVFLLPHGITVDKDHIWLTDVGSHQIYKFTKVSNFILLRQKFCRFTQFPSQIQARMFDDSKLNVKHTIILRKVNDLSTGSIRSTKVYDPPK